MIYNPKNRINNELASLLDNFLYEPAFYNWNQKNNRSSNFKKNDDAYIVEVELPGYNKKTLSIEIENKNLLVIRSKKEKEENKILYRLELSKEIDCENIKAKSEDGILHLTLPKLEENKKKCIIIE